MEEKKTNYLLQSKTKWKTKTVKQKNINKNGLCTV